MVCLCIYCKICTISHVMWSMHVRITIYVHNNIVAYLLLYVKWLVVAIYLRAFVPSYQKMVSKERPRETICSYGKTKENPNDILCNNHSDWVFYLALDQWNFIILNNFGTNTYKQSRPDLFGRFGDKLIGHFGLSRTFLSAFLAALKGNYRPFSIFIGNLPMADDNLNPCPAPKHLQYSARSAVF